MRSIKDLQAWERLFKKIVWTQLGDIKDKDILDFGSGEGITSDHFAKSNRVVAVEPWEDMLKDAWTDHDYRQVVGDIKALSEFEDNSFDMIICHNVLEYVDDKANVVRELARVLKPGGSISLAKHNRNGRVMQMAVLLDDFDKANALLDGEDSTASKFGAIRYYDDSDVTKWCPELYIEKTYGLSKEAFGYIKPDNGLSAVMKGFVIYGKNKSAAQKYASSNVITFYNKLDTIRLAGKDRYETAVEISKYRSIVFYESSTVILANGMNYADALAAASLARYYHAPILLTNTHSLNPATREEIKRLDAREVIILGGENAVGKEVVDELIQNGIRQEYIARLYGKDRYATAVAISKHLSKDDSFKRSVFFVYGNGFADSLSIGSVAAKRFNPIIYLRTNGEIDEATASYLAEIKGKVKNAYVIGGEGVISDDMMKKAAAAVGVDKPIRIAGANRYDTCIAVNNFGDNVYFRDAICVVTGKNFPDALAVRRNKCCA